MSKVKVTAGHGEVIHVYLAGSQVNKLSLYAKNMCVLLVVVYSAPGSRPMIKTYKVVRVNDKSYNNTSVHSYISPYTYSNLRHLKSSLDW